MPTAFPPLPARLLNLSGNHWIIRAGDADAAPVVVAFGKAMSLPSVNHLPQQFTGRWRELRVVTCSGQTPPQAEYAETGLFFCLVPPSDTHDRLVIGMSLIALTIARGELSHRGLLIHGALASAPENIGGGIIMAGPAEVGKTTASKRLPPPWRSLSDDTTLIVCDTNGQYFAHPWPTWSIFFSTGDGRPGPGGTWEVQEGLPLRAIYFLKQAEEDSVQTLPTANAVTYLMETVKLVSSLMTRDLSIDLIQKLHRSQLAAVEKLVSSVPAYALHLSLRGTFWKNIEETLSRIPLPLLTKGECTSCNKEIYQPQRNAVQAIKGVEISTVCYFGPSMNPTLRNQDILEVIPYSGMPVQRGDIVYYSSPVDGRRTIHRVVRVTPDGIYTRGDNNPADDPYVVLQKDIIGRVATAWRYGTCRKIPGGTQGIWSGHLARISNRLTTCLSAIFRGMYHSLASSGVLLSALPSSMQPCVVEFKQRYQPSIIKLLVNGKVIGQYDPNSNLWEINRPWRLIVDESKLPAVHDPHSEDQLPMKDNFMENKLVISKVD